MDRSFKLLLISTTIIVISLYLFFWAYPTYKSVEYKNNFIDNFPIYRQVITDLEKYNGEIILGNDVRNIITIYKDIPIYIDNNQIGIDVDLSDLLSTISRTDRYECKVLTDQSNLNFGLYLDRR